MHSTSHVWKTGLNIGSFRRLPSRPFLLRLPSASRGTRQRIPKTAMRLCCNDGSSYGQRQAAFHEHIASRSVDFSIIVVEAFGLAHVGIGGVAALRHGDDVLLSHIVGVHGHMDDGLLHWYAGWHCLWDCSSAAVPTNTDTDFFLKRERRSRDPPFGAIAPVLMLHMSLKENPLSVFFGTGLCSTENLLGVVTVGKV